MEKLSAQLPGKSWNVHVKRKVCGTIFSALLATATFGQGVGINTTTPDPSAALDIQATDKGLLIPRVSLTFLGDDTTIPNPATGLLIYNTNAEVSGGAGLYYNIGTPQNPQWHNVSRLMLPYVNAVNTDGAALQINNFNQNNGDATAISAISSNGYALRTDGKVRIAGSNQNPGSGKVLTSDASGNAGWDGGVAFRVSDVLDNGAHVLAPNTDYKVPFKTKNYDRTNNYTMHGLPGADTFVAPIHGIFHFDFQVTYEKGHRLSVGLYVKSNSGVNNGSVREICGNGTLTGEHFGCGADVQLFAGDEVYVGAHHNEEENMTLYRPSYFNGHFVMSTK